MSNPSSGFNEPAVPAMDSGPVLLDTEQLKEVNDTMYRVITTMLESKSYKEVTNMEYADKKTVSKSKGKPKRTKKRSVPRTKRVARTASTAKKVRE